jgi:hypothetical protein
MSISLEWFEASLRKLCYRVPAPVQRVVDGAEIYRFPEQTIQNAILLKTARYVSGLHAGNVLLHHGFVQELGTLQRTLDDFEQDAIFLALACIYDDLTEHHARFLASFWLEEPTYGEFVLDPKNKDEVPRRHIISYISRRMNGGTPDHAGIATAKYIARTYSGYVHGAAPHLMDMFDPTARRFAVDGVTFPALLATHKHDFENYMFRGVVLLAVAAQALGDKETHESAMTLHSQIQPFFT